MGTTVDTADLVSASEVAELLGLAQHNSVTTYMHRYADFPQPVINKSGGRVRLWLRHDIQLWDATRKAGGS